MQTYLICLWATSRLQGKRSPQLQLWCCFLAVLGFSFSSFSTVGKQFWFWHEMRDLFFFILISNFSLEMFGPYSVSICSPLPRAAGLLAEGKFVPVLQVQRHQQSCSQSTLLRRRTVTNKIEEVQENVKKKSQGHILRKS